MHRRFLRRMILFLCCFFAWFQTTANAYTQPDATIVSEATLLYHQPTNTVLFAKQETTRLYPASLTKIMTAYTVLRQNPNLQERITITQPMLDGLAKASASVAGFKVGEVLSIEDLLYGLLLSSGADAANALAYAVAGGIPAFVDMMNAEVQQLQLVNTQFRNPSGLDHDEQYTTAQDMLIILQAALEYDIFRTVASSPSHTLLPTNKHPNGLTLNNSAHVMQDESPYYVPYVEGGKTGFTGKAGRCLATWSLNQEYILISMLAPYKNQYAAFPQTYADANKLYDWVYRTFDVKTLYEKDALLFKIPVKWSWTSSARIHWQRDVNVLVESLSDARVQVEYILDREYKAPLDHTASVGIARFTYMDEVILEEPLYIDKDIKKSMIVMVLDYVISFIITMRYFVLAVILLLVGTVYMMRRQGRGYKKR